MDRPATTPQAPPYRGTTTAPATATRRPHAVVSPDLLAGLWVAANPLSAPLGFSVGTFAVGYSQSQRIELEKEICLL